MFSTKQARFLLGGLKKLNSGVAVVKRLGRPAEEVGMTASEFTRIRKARLASELTDKMVRGRQAASSAIGAAYRAAAEKKASTFGRGMARTPGLGGYFAKPTFDRMPKAHPFASAATEGKLAFHVANPLTAAPGTRLHALRIGTAIGAHAFGQAASGAAKVGRVMGKQVIRRVRKTFR